MKTFQSLSLAGTLVAAIAISTHGAIGAVTQRGPAQLQLDARAQIDPTEFGPDTTGLMRLHLRDNERTRREILQIRASGFEPDSPVGLTAAIGSDDNVSTILTTQADRRGKVVLSYLSREPAPARVPRRPEPLPDSLLPLTNVRAICLENSSLQVVGFAWVVNSQTYRYLVRRNLVSADGVAEGSMRLVANQRRVNFNLLAGGLNPGAEYSLVVNGTPVHTATADDRGRVQIRGWGTNAVPVLQLRTLELAANGGGTVLSTTLPE